MSILVFLVLSVVIHLTLLTFLHGKVFASVLVIIGAALSAFLYQLWVYVDLGYLEPFYRIAAAVQFGISMVAGIVTLLVFKKMKRRSHERHPQP